MRVAIVQETIDATRGGAETATLELARHLARLGPEVTVLCGPPASPPGAHAAEARLRVQPLVVTGGSRLQRCASFLRAAEAACRDGGFDIVHAIMPCRGATVYQPRGGTYPEAIARSLAMHTHPATRWLRALGKRFNARQRYLLKMEQALLGGDRAQRPAAGPWVAALSEYVRAQVRRDYPGTPAERVRVIFNAVDFEPTTAADRAAVGERLDVAPGRPVVLFAAHNFKLKGLGELIRAMAAPAGHSADWVVVVAGRDEPRVYAQLAQRLGVAVRMRFVGTKFAVRDLLAVAGVLAHPTWYDPCSRVALEALCAGVPVVTTRWNGAAEMIDPGRTGRVVGSPDEVDTLAEAVRACLEPSIGQAARRAAPALRERLSMVRHARELLALYEEIRADGT